ncbi:MAG: hypothetical protein JSS98_15945 [Bacteroidetes bacterium]|nr:hypothetical protein [Bacteroidota bacterium]
MDTFNRDLLVMFKEQSNPQAIENEVEQLHELLYAVEKIENVVKAHEVIDINKRKIHASKLMISETLKYKKLKPFVFLNNMN